MNNLEIKLSEQDTIIFTKAMLRPPKPSKTLEEAFKLHNKLVISNECWEKLKEIEKFEKKSREEAGKIIIK